MMNSQKTRAHQSLARALRSTLAVGLCALFIAGCTTYNPLSGGASMRVEVFSYAGPLTDEPETQVERMTGILQQLDLDIEKLIDLAIMSLQANASDSETVNFSTQQKHDQDAFVRAMGRRQVEIRDALVRLENDLHLRVENAKKEAQAATGTTETPLEKVFTEIQAEIKTLSAWMGDTNEILQSYNENPNQAREALANHMSVVCQRHVRNPDQHFRCLILSSMVGDLMALRTLIRTYKDKDITAAVKEQLDDSGCSDKACDNETLKALIESTQSTVMTQLRGVSKVAARLRILSEYWAQVVTITNFQPDSFRQLAVSISNLAAQYGQQLHHRSDTLMKLVKTDTRPEDMPLSIKLRNTGPSEFVNLFVWRRAFGRPLDGDLLSEGPFISQTEEGSDRVRSLERLYQSDNWEKINEVFASGRGEVAMLLVKDDIGNWDLKSFSSDPTKLLRAYTDIGTEILKRTAAFAAGGPAATSALSAGDLASIQNSAAVGNALGNPSQSAFAAGPAQSEATSAAMTRDEMLLASARSDLGTQLKEVEAALTPAIASHDAAQELLKKWQAAHDPDADAKLKLAVAEDQLRADNAAIPATNKNPCVKDENGRLVSTGNTIDDAAQPACAAWRKSLENLAKDQTVKSIDEAEANAMKQKEALDAVMGTQRPKMSTALVGYRNAVSLIRSTIENE